MPTYPCIFCPKSHHRRSNRLMPFPVSGPVRSGDSVRIATPVFMGRVSPVLDTCTQLGICKPGGKRAIVRRTIPLKGHSIFERADEIKKLGIGVIICGAVSDAFYNLLKASKIELICGIAGDIEEVIDAYHRKALDQPRFRMPGSG